MAAFQEAARRGTTMTDFGVHTPLEAMSPIAVEPDFTRKYIEKANNDFLVRRIQNSFDRAAWEKDFVIIEGTGHAGVGSVFDLSNARVAAMLDARGVPLVAQVGELGGYLCGRRLYETMLVWETDPSLPDSEDGAAFADVWCAIPKVVFSRTLDSVQGNARLAEASVAEEAAAALDATDNDVSIGGAGLAAAAIELGLVDELRMFRNPVVIGGGTPFLPPVTEDVPLDLIETRTFGSRVIYERYQRVRGVL